jgi:hypothetical protein
MKVVNKMGQITNLLNDGTTIGNEKKYNPFVGEGV